VKKEVFRRLFFACWPDQVVRQACREWQRRCVPGEARRTHPEDLHLTLHFLGQIHQPRIVELLHMAREIRAQAFQLRLDELGHFARPRVLWAGPSLPPEGLLMLQQRLGEGLAGLGLCLETRPYRPHLTLARKVAEKPQVTDLKPIKWHVTRWALVESRPGRLPLYQPLEIWPLRQK